MGARRRALAQNSPPNPQPTMTTRGRPRLPPGALPEPAAGTVSLVVLTRWIIPHPPPGGHAKGLIRGEFAALADNCGPLTPAGRPGQRAAPGTSPIRRWRGVYAVGRGTGARASGEFGDWVISGQLSRQGREQRAQVMRVHQRAAGLPRNSRIAETEWSKPLAGPRRSRPRATFFGRPGGHGALTASSRSAGPTSAQEIASKVPQRRRYARSQALDAR